MAEGEQSRFPDNQPYIGSLSGSRSQHDSSVRTMSAALLAERVQELQDQLSHIASALNEDGRQNQAWQQQMLSENKRISELLAEKEEEICSLKEAFSEADEERNILRANLLKQNQKMEVVHRQSHQSRVQNSRVASAQLQQKILEMNDEVSTLLGKIQQLIEQNNQQLSYIEQLKQVVDDYKSAHEMSNAQIQKLVDENNYLKEEIKQVEAMAITQHAENHDHYMEQLQQAKLEIEQFKGESEQKGDSNQNSKELQQALAEVHSLEEELLQQREIERALKKKYEERLTVAEKESESLSQQLSKAKSKYRQLQHSCSEHKFTIEQFQKEKERNQITKSTQTFNEEHFRHLVSDLEKEKEELRLKLLRAQRAQKSLKSEPSELYYSSMLELEANVGLLRKQLGLAQDQLARSRCSVREVSELARRWETDYRQLSRDYQEALQTRRTYEDRVIIQQAELSKHKEIYQKLVKKYDNFEGLYRELEEKVRMLESRKDRPSQRVTSYSMQSTDLIRLENSAIKQQLIQLKHELKQREDEVSELRVKIVSIKQQSIQINEKMYVQTQSAQNSNTYEIQRFKARQRELQRLVQALRNRLAAQSNQANEEQQDKIKELSQQLMRVNKALNQRQSQFDALKLRYSDAQDQLSRMQSNNSSNKIKLQLSNLKTEYVALQRRFNENEMNFKKQMLEKDYERQSLIVENAHHRKKIEDLMVELEQERNSIDYGKLTLSLAQLKNKQLQKELKHSQNKVNDLLQQRNSSYARSRKNSQNSYSQKGKESNSSLQKNQVQRQNIKITPLNQSLNVRSNESIQVQVSNHFEYTQKRNGSNSNVNNVSQKREWAEASQIYEQLMKEREAVRQIRSDFQKRWTGQTAQSHS